MNFPLRRLWHTRRLKDHFPFGQSKPAFNQKCPAILPEVSITGGAAAFERIRYTCVSLRFKLNFY